MSHTSFDSTSPVTEQADSSYTREPRSAVEPQARRRHTPVCPLHTRVHTHSLSHTHQQSRHRADHARKAKARAFFTNTNSFLFPGRLALDLGHREAARHSARHLPTVPCKRPCVDRCQEDRVWSLAQVRVRSPAVSGRRQVTRLYRICSCLRSARLSRCIRAVLSFSFSFLFLFLFLLFTFHFFKKTLAWLEDSQYLHKCKQVR
jgi:hypothetical protein